MLKEIIFGGIQLRVVVVAFHARVVIAMHDYQNRDKASTSSFNCCLRQLLLNLSEGSRKMQFL